MGSMGKIVMFCRLRSVSLCLSRYYGETRVLRSYKVRAMYLQTVSLGFGIILSALSPAVFYWREVLEEFIKRPANSIPVNEQGDRQFSMSIKWSSALVTNQF